MKRYTNVWYVEYIDIGLMLGNVRCKFLCSTFTLNVINAKNNQILNDTNMLC